jgi:Na+/H+-dicarboxylate symporter
MSLATKSLLGLVAGIAVGVALKPAVAVASAALAIADVVGPLWINAILMTIVPLVVAKIIISIAGAADVTATGRAGAWALAWFALLLIGGGVLTAVILRLLLPQLPFDPSAIKGFGGPVQGLSAAPGLDVRQWLVSLVPANPLKAAADGAMLPLIVFSTLFALALTRCGDASRQAILSLCRAVDEAITVLLKWIIVVAPIGIFALALGMTLQLGGEVIGAVAFYMILASLTLVVFTLALYPLVALVAGVPLRQFARACAPAQIMAFSTHSSIASLPAMLEGAERRLALPRATSDCVLPLAVATFKYSSPIWFLTVVLLLERVYGVTLDAPRLLSVIVTAVAMSVAVGGIPSGAVFVVVPVLLAAGLPQEILGVLLAVDPIPNGFRTVANVTGDMAVATMVGAPDARKAQSAGSPARMEMERG